MVGVSAGLEVDVGTVVGRLMHPALSRRDDDKTQAVMRIDMIAGLCSMRVGLAMVNSVSLCNLALYQPRYPRDHARSASSAFLFGAQLVIRWIIPYNIL